MEHRRFGPTKREVPVIGQGTWDIEQEADRAEAIAALRLGLDLGATHIDTAEMYGDGEAERIVGEAIAGRRDEVFLVSKVLPKHAGRRRAIEACEASLRRLRTDHLDVYLLHWRERTPLPETLAAFEDLQRAGKILAWGVSNFDVADLEAMLAIAGEGRCACNQVLYHLRERAIEHAVLPWCERHDIPVVAYSPLGSGRFPGPRAHGGKALEHIAAAHAASPRQAALRFLLRRPSVFTIPKAARAEHAA
ncbi:MAG TPA: aldo/keto reductase, partial [Methylomirabilota bacterium]|nr:aldo/keto reductase [Methylomirabilota bacterium]